MNPRTYSTGMSRDSLWGMNVREDAGVRPEKVRSNRDAVRWVSLKAIWDGTSYPR
jgi:hypothetical protein